MAGEIFISYRRADAAWAQLLHARLRAEGVEAWYDVHVGAGQDWRIATARALKASRIFVLLFSENAAESSDIAKELAAATLEKKLIVPVRLQNIALDGAFLYELASRNWVNAYENTEAQLGELAQSLAHLVRTGVRDENILPRASSGSIGGNFAAASKKPVRAGALIAAAIAIIAVSTIAAWKAWPLISASKTPPSAMASLPSLPGTGGVSIAVLPFMNLSSDKEQEFFSDGVTEEITSALAKVPGLTVIGRTSAFQFKGENKDMRAIGRALNARYLIEGSVRKDGDQVRITAQLIRADDGTHLWTESYDRKLKGIFALQEDIATAIAAALKIPLGLRQGESLVSNRTDNTDSYQDYLRAQAFFRARKIEELRSILKTVVARDPGYAPAWALLAESYGLPEIWAPLDDAIREGAPEKGREYARSQYREMEQAARKAISLDPQNAVAYAALGSLSSSQGDWAASEDYIRKALSFDPNNPDILYSYGYLLAATGRIRDSMKIQGEIMAREPFVPVYRGRNADLLWAMGQNDAAIKLAEPMSRDYASTYAIRLGKFYATAGRYTQAADAIASASKAPLLPAQSLEAAARLMRSAPNRVSTPEALPLLPGGLSFVYLFIGAQDRFLDFVEREIALGYYGGIYRDPWAPPSAALRKTERFKTFVRKARLLEYWRARGWPEYCHPVGAEDFACG